MSVRDWPTIRMWADREDITDGVTYEDRVRRLRYRIPGAMAYLAGTNALVVTRGSTIPADYLDNSIR